MVQQPNRDTLSALGLIDRDSEHVDMLRGGQRGDESNWLPMGQDGQVNLNLANNNEGRQSLTVTAHHRAKNGGIITKLLEGNCQSRNNLFVRVNRLANRKFHVFP